MKRFLIFALLLALCLGGCKKKQTDIPGGSAVPEDIDWKLWEQYTPATLHLGEEAVDVLIAMDAIHLAVYYDRDEQELLGSITIITPLSDVEYSRNHLRILDQNGDGFDDICIPDMLQNGDREMNWWLWEPKEKKFRFAPEHSHYQEDISADVGWMAGKSFIDATMDTPDGPQDLLVLVEDQTVWVYLDKREQQLFGSAKIPEPLSDEALEHLDIYTYWDCRDLNGDGWGDLQLPYLWKTGDDGSLYQYCHCWLWDPGSETYRYDPQISAQPVV